MGWGQPWGDMPITWSRPMASVGWMVLCHEQHWCHFTALLARLVRQRACRRTFGWKPGEKRCAPCPALRMQLRGGLWWYQSVSSTCWAAALSPMGGLPKLSQNNSSKFSGFPRLKGWSVFAGGESGVNHIKGELKMPTNGHWLILEISACSTLSVFKVLLQKLMNSNVTNWRWHRAFF